MTDWRLEEIRYEVERVKFLSLLTVALGGSSFGLLLGDFTLFRLGLAGVGLLLTVLLGVVSWRLDASIRAELAQKKETV
jgi:hypothetical protein